METSSFAFIIRNKNGVLFLYLLQLNDKQRRKGVNLDETPHGNVALPSAHVGDQHHVPRASRRSISQVLLELVMRA